MTNVYIYNHDKYGNPGPYYTTLELFEEDLAEIGYKDGLYDSGDDIMDNDDEIVLVPATPENIARFHRINDPLGLM